MKKIISDLPDFNKKIVLGHLIPHFRFGPGLLCVALLFFVACKDTNSRQTTTAGNTDTLSTNLPDPETGTDGLTLYAWVDQLRVRQAPDKTAAVISEVAEGGQLTFLGEKSDFTEKINLRGTLYDEPWLKVKTSDGKTGWVYGGGVKFYAPVVDQSSSPYDDCMKLQAENKWDQALACIEKVRQQQLKSNSRWVEQKEDQLIITLLDGSKKTFKNDTLKMEEESYQYLYSYYLPQMGFHVLRLYGFEWSAYLLVNDKSGKTTEIYGYPKASPDFKNLLYTNMDLEAGFEFNGLGMYGFTENGFEELFKKELTEYGPHSPIWLDDSTVEIIFEPSPEHPELDRKKVQLVQEEDGTWNLLE